MSPTLREAVHVSCHGYSTFFGEVPVEHQFAVPQVVQHWPKVCWVSVNEIGTGFVLKESQRESSQNQQNANSTLVATTTKKKNSAEKCSTKYYGQAGIKVKHLTQKRKIC